MLRPRTLNNKMNHIHEWALSIVYSVNSSFYELVDKDGSFTIHLRNVQSLAIEIYKYLHDLFPAILSEGFKVNEIIPYDLRMRNELYARNPKTVIYVTETTFLSPKICALILQNICHKNIIDFSSLPCFKKSICKWKPNCPCRLCKIFFQHVGFILLNSSPPFSFFSLVYLKFVYLFVFILPIINNNYSYIIYLGILI